MEFNDVYGRMLQERVARLSLRRIEWCFYVVICLQLANTALWAWTYL